MATNEVSFKEFYQKPTVQPIGNTTQPIRTASSDSAGSGGGYFDAGPRRGFISPQQGQRMLDNPDSFKATPGELRLIREGLNLPQASTGEGWVKGGGYMQASAPQKPGEGWAWFGDPKGESPGRWGIDTDSDYWDTQAANTWDPEGGSLSDYFKRGESTFTKQAKAENKYNLPGWFQGSVIEHGEHAGKAFGMNYGGGLGWLSQGGDLTAEHYNQPGNWSWTPQRRADGSGSHEVGDIWWDRANRSKFEEGGEYADWDSQQQWRDAPDYVSQNPEEYQEGVDAQIERMRQQKYEAATAEDANPWDITALQGWDAAYGIEGGKHWTQDWKGEAERAERQEQRKQDYEGVVRGEHETDQGDKGFTLAERLKQLDQTIEDTKYTTGDKIKDFFGI